MRPTASIANMKGLMLLLPMLQLAAGQSTVTATPSVDSGTSLIYTVGSVAPITTAFEFGGTTFTGVNIPILVTVMSDGINVYSFDDPNTHPPVTTTVDFSIITANGTVTTLRPTGSVPPPVDTTLYPSTSISNAIGSSATTTGTRSGTATGTQVGPASFTNAAPTADVKLGLGILGFAGAVAAVGL